MLFFKFRTVPATVGWTWNVNDWSVALKSKVYPLNSGEIDQIKMVALETMRRAYVGFAVRINDGGGGEHEIQVKDGILCGCCGQTPGLVKYSSVYYNMVRDKADNYGPDRDRQSVIVGIGRGIGNVAAHELLHQFTLEDFHDYSDRLAYDYGTCDREEQYYGGDLHWTTRGLGLLNSFISRAN